MTAPVSSHCSQSDRVPEWTGGVIDYWQLSDRILNYYWRVCWLAGWGSAFPVPMLTESFPSFWILKYSFVHCISVSDPATCEFRERASAVSLMRHIFYTNALRATEVGFMHFNISIIDCISAATALTLITFSIRQNSGCDICLICNYY